MHKYCVIFFCLFSLGLTAQAPDTDLWLFKLEADKKAEKLFPVSALNITSRQGYDNQPSFSHDGKKIYYVSIREDKQADIFYYDLGSKKISQLTKSRESEYSPVCNTDTKFLNSVVVEADSAQRIHYLDVLKGTDAKRLEPDSIGYYTFLNTDTVIYYKLTEPHSLRYYVASTGEDKFLGYSPTRTFRAINRHSVIYGLKDSASVNFYKYDFLLHKAVLYCTSPSLNEDIIWHPLFGLVKSEGSKLVLYNENSGQWELLYELGLFGIKKITRFAFDSKNKFLVVVDNPG